MNKIKLLVIIAFIIGNLPTAKCQITPPYFNDFDSVGDTAGWKHYAISGIDDWQTGVPHKPYQDSAFTRPNAWCTGLTDSFAANSNRALETPYFNLTDTSKRLELSFVQKTNSGNFLNRYYLEYSIGSNGQWLLLDNGLAAKNNWQSNYGFSNNYQYYFSYSAIQLIFLQGKDSVKFRFRCISTTVDGDGWLIDNFNIKEEVEDIYAAGNDTVIISKNCSSFVVKPIVNVATDFSTSFIVKTNFYFSQDLTLDPSDVLVGSQTINLGSTSSGLTQTIQTPSNLSPGYYYILYFLDALDSVKENNESNNLGFIVLKIDSIHPLPYLQDFENPASTPWSVYIVNKLAKDTLDWYFGSGFLPHLEGAHSGANAWSTSYTIKHHNSDIYFQECVESPYVDLTSDTGHLVMSFWFKTGPNYNPDNFQVQYSSACGDNWKEISTIPACRDDDWDFLNIPLDNIISLEDVKFRINNFAGTPVPGDFEGAMFDDVYIGTAKPDLSIERDKLNRFTPSSLITDTLKYFLCNSGLSPAGSSTSAFYWSADSILDASDILLGTKQEPALTDTERLWTNFVYSKPTTAQGKYYIIYVLDSGEVVDEMWENNNTGYFTLYQNDIAATPYFNDFETQLDGWRHNSSLGKDYWKWGAHSLFHAFSGSKGIVIDDSALTKPYTANRMSEYTPVFNLTDLTHPVLEFDMHLDDFNDCHCNEGDLNMSYSVDGGATWIVLDTVNRSYSKWYNTMQYDYTRGVDRAYFVNRSRSMFAPSENRFAPFSNYNSRDEVRGSKYIIDINFLSAYKKIQFRYNFSKVWDTYTYYGDAYSQIYNGLLIDNFIIREAYTDLAVPYKKSLMISSLSKQIKFFMNIKNQGNYISNPSITKYYLSKDSLPGGGDYYLGEYSIPAVRPDFSSYVNTAYNAPANLPDYKYLLYHLDDSAQNVESNKINNTGYWKLALDSVSSYPYFNDFNDTVIDGWHQYAFESRTGGFEPFRITNQLVPGEYNHYFVQKSGEWHTEEVYWDGIIPYYYLETPAFNFTSFDSLFMSFNLICTGDSLTDGGNFEFSKDGGNNWTVLSASYGKSHNWYNVRFMSAINNEPGWAKPPRDQGTDVLDSTSYDISFLHNQPHVAFRFKYYSSFETWGPGSVQGLRLDNFKIEAANKKISAVKDISSESINAYTNENKLYLESQLDAGEQYHLTMRNITGQPVYTTDITVNKGFNQFTLPANVAAGVYLVTITNQFNSITRKTIITGEK